MKQIFFIDEVKELINSYLSDNISISKLTEVLNEKANAAYGDVITGVIVRHRDAPRIYGGVAIETPEAKYAIIQVSDQKEAYKRIGQSVKCRQNYDYYKAVDIVEFID